MYTAQFNITDWTSAPLQIGMTARFDVSPEIVFHALSDPEMMCRTFPWMERVSIDSSLAVDKGGVGTIRTCTLGNGLVLEEEIVDWQPPQGYAFRGFDETHPFGMRGHVGVLAFASVKHGTQLTWQQYFDHSNVVAMREQLAESMQSALTALVQRYGGSFAWNEEYPSSV